jgi:biopolymer transport protein ExbD
MAAIDVGGGSKRSAREYNREIPLIPFIDCLLCLVSFLLLTAVWTANARIDATALVPGGGPDPGTEPRQLHVYIRDHSFELKWKQGGTVLSSASVERHPVKWGDQVRYPALDERLAAEWKQYSAHQAPSDRTTDRAVVYTGNTTEFGELVAVLDALEAPIRTVNSGGAQRRVPAFRVSFSVN